MPEIIGCVNGTNCIRVRSGPYLDLADPQIDQFEFSDIAGGLSKLCRFGGQANKFYSVAEHSVLCSQQARKDGLSLNSQRAVFMHDAAEAFCGDIVRPLKKMLKDYSLVESRMMSVIAVKFDIDFAAAEEEIHDIDSAIVIAERDHLFDSDCVPWFGEETVRKIDIVIRGWYPHEAEVWFKLIGEGLGLR